MILFDFAAAAAKRYEVFDKLCPRNHIGSGDFVRYDS